MIDFIKDWFEEVKKVRAFPIVIIYIGLIFILTNRLFQLQIIEGNKYSQESQKMLQKKRYIKGTRGNIYDCNGVPLAINEISYSITLEDNGKLKSNEDKNEMIVNLLKILKRNHCSIDVHFEIKRNKTCHCVWRPQCGSQGDRPQESQEQPQECRFYRRRARKDDHVARCRLYRQLATFLPRHRGRLLVVELPFPGTTEKCRVAHRLFPGE